MKLESLNNSKYSLTPEKMGELVGGEKVVICTGPGKNHYINGNTIEYSADKVTYANHNDYANNIVESDKLYYGDNDCVQAGCPCNKK